VFQATTEETGTVRGRVLSRVGRPIEGVLVFVERGLDNLIFPPVDVPVVLENRGSGFDPSLAIVRVGQPLVLRSEDSELHTVAMYSEARRLFRNDPILPLREKTIRFEVCRGLVTIKCTVHGAEEDLGYVAVMCHPFAALTDAQGRFVFRGVPLGAVAVSAWRPGYRKSTQEAQVAHELVLQLQLVVE
jgi:plastocyanin